MEIIAHQLPEKRIAEIVSDTLLINTAKDGLNILVDLYYQQFDKIILQEHHITPHFFELKTGIAGELLQKFSNYRMQLSIVGTFENYTSDSIQRFFKESNKTGNISFVQSLEQALC
ncbi:MAG: DUF4180 domain-containing protein [Bacteroidota bacterium]